MRFVIPYIFQHMGKGREKVDGREGEFLAYSYYKHRVCRFMGFAVPTTSYLVRTGDSPHIPHCSVSEKKKVALILFKLQPSECNFLLVSLASYRESTAAARTT